jgi:polyferredoxin
MSQQHAHSDQNHFNDSASYSAGYEESPRYQGYSANIDGQKLSPSENQTSPTAQQRLILAIVSLVLLFLLFLAVVILGVSGALAPTMARDFAPVFVFMFLGFFVAVIVINIAFNRKR